MATKSTQNIGGSYSSEHPGTSIERQSAANTPLKDGTNVNPHMGPTDLEDILQFYFGEPTSSHENRGNAGHSRW